jgi:hypothetical protein
MDVGGAISHQSRQARLVELLAAARAAQKAPGAAAAAAALPADGGDDPLCSSKAVAGGLGGGGPAVAAAAAAAAGSNDGSCTVDRDAAAASKVGETDKIVIRALQQLADWDMPDTQRGEQEAAAQFVWYRRALPLVCKRWRRLLAHTGCLWGSLAVQADAEAQYERQSASFRSTSQGGVGSGTAAWPVQFGGGAPGFSAPVLRASMSVGSMDLSRYCNAQSMPFDGERVQMLAVVLNCAAFAGSDCETA